jgi:hypothetical protein
MDEKQRVSALLDGRLSGPERDAAVSAILASDDGQVLLADAAAVLTELESQPDGGENPMGNAVMHHAEAELAEAEMFADLLREALLTHYSGTVRPVHRVVVGRLLRDGAGLALVAALDAVREVAGRGESRTVAQEAFIWALTRDVAQARPASSAPPVEAAGRVQEIGEDAYLLERLATEREAYALEAAEMVPVEARRAREEAADLRTLAMRHAVQHARGEARVRGRGRANNER